MSPISPFPASKEERDRILQLVEKNQITAAEAAQLLDALEAAEEHTPEPKSEPSRIRIIRVRVSNLKSRTQRVNLVATLPVPVITSSLHFGMQLIPQLNTNVTRDLIHAINTGSTGRLVDLQDLERGERLEVFAE